VTDRRSFWSSVPGVITGVASILTVTVALIGAGVTLGWFGSGVKDEPPASAVTTTTGATAATTSSTPLQASPASLRFEGLGARDQRVTVRNASAGSLTLRRPTVAGVDAGEFEATDLTCGARLDANRTCEVTVVYLATKAGTATATLVIQPEGAPALEVALRGSRVI